MRENIIELLTNSILAGGISALISFLLNYYLLPFPVTLLDNAIGHGIGGFMCGFISAFVGLSIYAFHRRMQKVQTPG